MHPLTTPDHVLEPLTVDHADAMFEVLSDPEIYHHLDYPPPPSLEHLRNLYSRLETRSSPDGAQTWLNWVIRPHGRGPVGYVQATIVSPACAWIGYVLSSRHWGRGHAHAATDVMLSHLATAYGVTRFLATVEAENDRSIRLLERLGFHPAPPTDAVDEELSATERLYVRDGEPQPAE